MEEAIWGVLAVGSDGKKTDFKSSSQIKIIYHESTGNIKEIIITTPSYYVTRFILFHHQTDIRDAVAQALKTINHKGPIPNITINERSRETTEAAEITIPRSTSPLPTKSGEYHSSRIDKEHTLKNIVVCEKNMKGVKLAQRVINEFQKTPRKASQSNEHAVIYGNSGIGKTHILHAIANEIIGHNKNVNIIYITSSDFLQRMTDSIKNKTMDEFKRIYSSADLLLVDDIQLLAGKPKTLTEFLEIFNQLAAKKRPIILACDKPPRDITQIPEQLKTRLCNCMLCRIERPELEARTEIVRINARKNRIKIDKQCAHYIASAVDSSVRHLEGAVKTIKATADYPKREITIGLIAEALQDIIPEPQLKFSIPKIQQEVAKFYERPVAEIKSSSRNPSLVLARQLAMFLCRELTNSSTTEIGVEFGGKNHSTVLYSCQTLERRMQASPDIQKAYRKITTTLHSYV